MFKLRLERRLCGLWNDEQEFKDQQWIFSWSNTIDEEGRPFSKTLHLFITDYNGRVSSRLNATRFSVARPCSEGTISWNRPSGEHLPALTLFRLLLFAGPGKKCVISIVNESQLQLKPRLLSFIINVIVDDDWLFDVPLALPHRWCKWFDSFSLQNY